MTVVSGEGQAKRVVVIGGGVVGVCAASWLLRDGHAVTIVEPGQIGRGASYGNAGCFNPSSVVPMSMPGNLIKVPGWLLDPLGPLSIRWSYLPTIAPWLIRFLRSGTRDKVEAQARALGDLLRDSVGVYRPLIINAGAQALVRQDGHLVVYPKRADFEADALAWKLRRDNGIAFTVLEDEALWQQEPALAHSCRLGVFFPDNGHTVNPNRLVQMLADAFLRDGGTILPAAAQGFEMEGERIRGVRTDRGLVSCEMAVIATGAHSKIFTRQLGDHIPLDTERGYHIVVPYSDHMPRIPIMDTSGKFVATPMEGGLRIAGTVEFAGLDAEPDWKRAHKLLTLGQRLLPELPTIDPRDAEVWMGFRPSMPDSLPVIGRSRRTGDIIYAFGHGHVGMAGGAQTGLLVADLVAGRAPRIPIAAFSPERFG
ncbi:FAD-dependent oxidoreductase [Agrobacterium vitis]|uniref:NAD(P)/FAD-dependent oxidoreductase n=1 Tax=Rhizobium/Agrobacterium group TaxID=227290 RepID=UPI00132595B9|nr:FAD-dependent oxidoreductase [Agrobacterium vitis]MCF1464398.1 FAD-dependent oxidoreductase [Allorhizobium ampelinum]MCF1495339.1 FAD-dependent oxidoreductase [Allorhizobium ampelinum]MUZ54204.1 FAD-dependent oxidoreductase [Agrobacterium vitis]MUZ93887.1 FAD-dependent oxidoreductase [Agrobacterium vitis]MVA41971.1 FAD-dependent oxidoreductase [Agrobacterium vitis]